MTGMSFDEAKAKRDSMPAWNVFEESLKSGGVAGTISRGGAAAISGARNRLASRFSKRIKRNTIFPLPPSSKARTMASAVLQKSALDKAANSGQVTNREFAKQSAILRRRQARVR